MHAGNIEQRIGAGAPVHAQTTPTVVHVGSFWISCLVATDPEDPDPHLAATPRRTPQPRSDPKSQISLARTQSAGTAVSSDREHIMDTVGPQEAHGSARQPNWRVIARQ
jgi:hypothetical protein